MPDEQNQTPEPGPQIDSIDRMQRIRVGLTGLAVVLLLVALATTVINRIGGNSANPGVSNATAAPGSNDEPLADLGVAPGAPPNETAPAPAPNPKR